MGFCARVVKASWAASSWVVTAMAEATRHDMVKAVFIVISVVFFFIIISSKRVPFILLGSLQIAQNH